MSFQTHDLATGGQLDEGSWFLLDGRPIAELGFTAEGSSEDTGWFLFAIDTAAYDRAPDDPWEWLGDPWPLDVAGVDVDELVAHGQRDGLQELRRVVGDVPPGHDQTHWCKPTSRSSTTSRSTPSNAASTTWRPRPHRDRLVSDCRVSPAEAQSLFAAGGGAVDDRCKGPAHRLAPAGGRHRGGSPRCAITVTHPTPL
ncbi:MAG TPA: hypothetical protein VIJ33_01930 [Solirubrobacteraceae bacterium]